MTLYRTGLAARTSLVRRLRFSAILRSIVAVSALAAPATAAAQCPPEPVGPEERATVSRNCEEIPFRPGRLAQGVYAGEFIHRAFAEKPGEQNRVMITLQGTLAGVVGETGSFVAGTAATLEFVVQHPAKEGEWITGLFTDASGALALAGASSHDRFGVEGGLAGLVVSFARDPKTGDGSSVKAPTVREVKIDFRLDSVRCGLATGTFSSALMDETLASFAAEGMTTNPGSARWFLSKSGKRDRFNEENLRKVEGELAETVKRGTDVPAGPGRRQAQSRFALMEAEINGACPYVGNAEPRNPTPGAPPDPPARCLLCFERCPTPDERACMRRMWNEAYVRTVTVWIERELQFVAQANIPPPRQAKGEERRWTRPVDYAGLSSYVREALEMDRQLSLRGVDQCTRGLQARVFEVTREGLSRLVRRLIEERHPPQDILTAHRQAALLGANSPWFRCDALDGVVAEAKAIRDDAIKYLRTRSSLSKTPEGSQLPKHWDTCDPDISRAWAMALGAESQMEKMGGSDGAALKFFQQANPRESQPGCPQNRPPG
jgi:hypothetical protein